MHLVWREPDVPPSPLLGELPSPFPRERPNQEVWEHENPDYPGHRVPDDAELDRHLWALRFAFHAALIGGASIQVEGYRTNRVEEAVQASFRNAGPALSACVSAFLGNLGSPTIELAAVRLSSGDHPGDPLVKDR